MSVQPGDGARAQAAVLVIGPAWVGDMVMAQSLYRLLKEQAPQRPIDVVAAAWSIPLLARMPEVRHAYTLQAGHGELALRVRWRLGRRLRAVGYDWAIVLPRSLKAALVPWFAGIPRRTGFVGEQRWGVLNDLRHLDRQALPSTVQRFLSLGMPANAPVDTIPHPRLAADAVEASRAVARLTLDEDQGPVLALCPGAEYGPAKRWPAEHYAELARRYLRRGWRVWLFGSAKEREITAAIAQAAPGAMDLAGRTTLAEAVDLLALADAVVSNDSGLMHVAAALQRPVVAIYGSSDPRYTPPLSDRARALWLHLPCSPCFARVCPLGHARCLWDITPDQVEAALRDLCSPSTR